MTPIQICRLLTLLAVVFSGACHPRDLAQNPKNETATPENRTTTIPLLGTAIPDGGPYFSLPKDTVSAHGPRNITRNILQDRKGHFWFASWEGIVHYDGQQFTNITLKYGLRHFHVFSILESKTGDLWFGTIGDGVYRFDGQRFTTFSTANGLLDNTVLCMTEDFSGHIWVGTQKGASCYDGNGFTHFTTQEGLPHNHVNALLQDKEGTIWMGTDGGVCLYRPAMAPASMSRLDQTDGKPFYNVRSIIADKNGDIWIGYAAGLCRYDGQNGETPVLITMSTTGTYNVFEDAKGNLWLSQNGGQGKGMALVKYDGRTFTEIKRERQVFGVEAGSDGSIWFGTEEGAYSYDPASKICTLR